MPKSLSGLLALLSNETSRRAVYISACLLALALLLHNHFQLVTHQGPIDYNEGAMVTITETIATGKSPYSFESQPSSISVYPPLYNIIMAPLTLAFENTLTLHRFVAGLFITASIVLCFLVTAKAGGSLINSFAAAILYYAALLYYSNPIASGNSTGLFFFLLCIFVPWHYRFSNKSLVISALAGIMAFYGKQYFLASLGYVALYVFLAVSKKKAIIFGALSTLALLLSVFMVHLSNPYFLDNTFFSIGLPIGQFLSNEFMLKQVLFFSETYISLFVLVILLGLLHAKNTAQKTIDSKEAGQPSINVRCMDAPLLTANINYFHFCFFVSLAIVAYIARNPGNYMTYLFQLISPFFLISLFSFLPKENRLKWASLPLIFFAFYKSYSILPHDYTYKQKPWDQLEKIVVDADEIYASTIMLELLNKHDKKIINNGHTNYFYFAQSKPDIFQPDNIEKSIGSIWTKYVDGIFRKIEHKEFDVIILDHWTQIPEPVKGSEYTASGKEHLSKYYQLKEKIIVSLTDRRGGGRYAMQIWTPR